LCEVFEKKSRKKNSSHHKRVNWQTRRTDEEKKKKKKSERFTVEIVREEVHGLLILPRSLAPIMKRGTRKQPSSKQTRRQAQKMFALVLVFFVALALFFFFSSSSSSSSYYDYHRSSISSDGKNGRGAQSHGRKKRDAPSVWQGDPIRFDVPDNLDVESSLTFAPPPPPDKPLFKIGWAKFKQMEDRVKNTEKDVFERGLRVSALKDKWADYLPRPPKNTLRPIRIAVPERVTASELESIKSRIAQEDRERLEKLREEKREENDRRKEEDEFNDRVQNPGLRESFSKLSSSTRAALLGSSSSTSSSSYKRGSGSGNNRHSSNSGSNKHG
jgi:hypothetical protein